MVAWRLRRAEVSVEVGRDCRMRVTSGVKRSWRERVCESVKAEGIGSGAIIAVGAFEVWVLRMRQPATKNSDDETTS